MIQMTTMAIYGKKCLKIFFRTKSLMILKLGMERQGLEVYTVYISDDPWLTLTNLTTMSSLAKFAFCAFSRPRYQSLYNHKPFTIGPLHQAQ